MIVFRRVPLACRADPDRADLLQVGPGLAEFLCVGRGHRARQPQRRRAVDEGADRGLPRAAAASLKAGLRRGRRSRCRGPLAPGRARSRSRSSRRRWRRPPGPAAEPSSLADRETAPPAADGRHTGCPGPAEEQADFGDGAAGLLGSSASTTSAPPSLRSPSTKAPASPRSAGDLFEVDARRLQRALQFAGAELAGYPLPRKAVDRGFELLAEPRDPGRRERRHGERFERLRSIPVGRRRIEVAADVDLHVRSCGDQACHQRRCRDRSRQRQEPQGLRVDQAPELSGHPAEIEIDLGEAVSGASAIASS